MARGSAGYDWQNNAGARLIAIVAVAVLGIVAVAAAALALTRTDDRATGAAPGPIPTYGAGASAAPAPERASIVVIGDDFTAGTAMNSGPTWPSLLDIDADVTPLAVAETGYTIGAAGDTFAARAATVPATADVVVFLGGGDDPLGSALQPAVAAALTAARSAAPDARLVVVGPPWTGNPDAVAGSMITRRDAVAAAATAAGAVFIDPIADEWFDGTGLVGSDGIHPTDAGHARMAERLRPVLQEAVVPAA